MHNHTNCHHVLNFCPFCNCVYCTRCGAEWHQYHPAWKYTPISNVSWDSTANPTDGVITISKTNESHTHG